MAQTTQNSHHAERQRLVLGSLSEAGTHDVIARGITDTHAQARADVAKVLPEDVETWKAA